MKGRNTEMDVEIVIGIGKFLEKEIGSMKYMKIKILEFLGILYKFLE